MRKIKLLELKNTTQEAGKTLNKKKEYRACRNEVDRTEESRNNGIKMRKGKG